MELRLGIDIACRAAHQASLADGRGEFVWSGRPFRTAPADLEALWASLPPGTAPADVTVVMEPTRNAWVPLAAWFRRRGASVVLVPPERAADLRAHGRRLERVLTDIQTRCAPIARGQAWSWNDAGVRLPSAVAL